MARRKAKQNPGVGTKGKGAMIRRHVSGDRNRASPAPIVKLYNSLTNDQKSAVTAMGHGSFLDIKCEHLHNPIINWFVQCYQPGRSAFVVPCRGTIPLTEESVFFMMGLPRGQLEVKYYADFELEAELSSRIFPGESSRPKVSEIGRKIEQYKESDDTFKELWMLYLVSIVVAPTTDIRMSNKCYPMLRDIGRANEMNFCKFVADKLHEHLSSGKYTRGCLLYCMLRYFSALDTDDLELELGDEFEDGNRRFVINRWTKVAVDVIGEMDAQELDPTKFGSMMLRDEFKDDIARDFGLFGGSMGFDAWMSLNTHPTCTIERKNKVYTLKQTLASGLNGLLSNFVQGMTESTIGETNYADDSNEDDSNEDDADEDEDGPVQPPVRHHVAQSSRAGKEAATSSSKVKTKDKGDASLKEKEGPALATGKGAVSPRKGKGGTTETEGRGDLSPIAETEEVSPTTGNRDASQVTGKDSADFSPPPMHSQIFLPSDSEKDLSDDSVGISEGMSDLTLRSTQQAEDQIRGSAASLAARLASRKHESTTPTAAEPSTDNAMNSAAAKGVEFPMDTKADQAGTTEIVKDATDNEQLSSEKASEPSQQNKDLCPENVDVHCEGSEKPTDHNSKGASSSSSKRKRQRLMSRTPTRKSPRLAHLNDGTSSRTAVVLSPTTTSTPTSRPVFDGKTKDSAVVISPTANISSYTSKVGSISIGGNKSASSDGKSKASAIPVSTTIIKSPDAACVGDGKTKSSAIEISPKVTVLQPKISVSSENMCRSLVLSPVAESSHVKGSGSSSKPWKLSPLVGANLGIPRFPRGSPVLVTDEIKELVRQLSESAKKQGILPKFGQRHGSSQGGLKRKRSSGSSSSSKPSDSRPGMFTPPGFHLGFTSEDSSGIESPPVCVDQEEDAMPKFALDVAPIAWAVPEGGPSKPAKGTTNDLEFEEFKLSKEVQDFILNKTEVLSAKGADELAEYDKYCLAFSKRRREIESAAAPETNLDGSAIQSITPKANPHKERVKASSRFLQSPFVGSMKVTAEQEDVYQKIMMSGKHIRPNKSNIKKYQIVKYEDSWVYTSDLADSVHARGELSNHCMEVGLEYLRRTNNVDGKMIMPYQLTDYLLTGQFEKKVVTLYFKRRLDYSLSVMKQRFEILDSLRGEESGSLVAHANALVSRIKAVWQIHYASSKVQIQNWELLFVNVPRQENIFNCGFHVLYNIEKWDGQNIPQIGKDDVFKLRRIMPHKWITADFNQEKDKWRCNLFNNEIRK